MSYVTHFCVMIHSCVCVRFHSYVTTFLCHNAFICGIVSRFIHTRHMLYVTHFCVMIHSCVYVRFHSYVTTFLCHNAFICGIASRFIHTRHISHMTHFYVKIHSCVTIRSCVCVTTHSYVTHDSRIRGVCILDDNRGGRGSESTLWRTLIWGPFASNASPPSATSTFI